MKALKIRDVPVLFILLFSFIASFAMGCSGGGGGGGGSGSPLPPGNAPTSLAAGMVFEFDGTYTRIEPVTSSTFTGTVDKTLNVISSGTGTSLDNSLLTTGSSGLTYTRNTPDLAKIVATNYPYRGPLNSPAQRGTIELQLTFSTPTSGTFAELGVGLPNAYSGGGTFTFTTGVVPVIP